MRDLQWFLGAVVVLCVPMGAGSGWADDGTDAGDAAALSITAEELKAHVDFLADDAREGRAAGSPGGRAAAEYIVEQLSDYPIEPAFDGSYFQEFGKGMRNVVGVLRGSDPALRDEIVVIGAHYDHVGMGGAGRGRMPGKGGDVIWNGADDNASGTSGVLEIAQAFSLLPKAPRRTILFMFFDGEERGLLGSRHYLQNPLYPVKKTVAMLNLDMIGRGEGHPALLYGTNTGEGFLDLVEECNKAVDLSYTVQKGMRYDSDHAHFVRNKIPVLFLFTDTHADYHRPSDHADKIDTGPMERIARLTFLILQDLANADERLTYRAPPPRQRRPLLGVRGEINPETGRYVIRRLSPPNGRAARAGLQAGDILLKFGDAEIKSRRDLLRALSKWKKGQTVDALILRNEEEITVPVPFDLDKKSKKTGWY